MYRNLPESQSRDNSLARPWLEAEVDIEWGKGFNREGDVLDVATKADAVIYDWLRHENPRALLADAMIATGRTGVTVICVVNAADKEFKADLAEWARERGSTVSFDGSTTKVVPEEQEGQ